MTHHSGQPGASSRATGLARVQQRQRRGDGVDREQGALEDAADRRQCADRIAQVQQQAPHEDEVEAAELRRVEVVDTQVAALDARTQGLVRQLGVTTGRRIEWYQGMSPTLTATM
ncbi:MAG TPA: hypothetical protein VK304_07015 [Thermoleophilaceae bacterium]|nr:hypothetical protein [Thermoleophilaceae bacterium]